MDKRSALAMGLLFLVWMSYMLWFAPKPKPPAAPLAVSDSLVSADSLAHAPRATGQPSVPEIAEENAPVAENTPVDTVTVSSDLYEYRFITRGGVLVKAWLKQYPSFNTTSRNPDSRKLPPVELIPPGSEFLSSRLVFGKADKQVDLGSRTFTPDRRELRLSNNNPEGSVSFVDTLSAGVAIRIVYTFHNDSYLIESEMYLPSQLHGQAESALEVSLGPSLLSNEKEPLKDYESYKAIYYDAGEVIEKSIKDLSKNDWAPSGEHRILWGGLKSQYFIATFFVPQNPMEGMSASGDLTANSISFRGRFPIPQAEKPVHYSLYVGPQAYDQITRLDYGLPKIFEYGWIIIRPFTMMVLRIMLWLHKYVSNYALILVLFGLMIKIVFYPLTIKSTKSQIKMQQIQPLMNEMRERFKDDPRKQQEEMLRMYREHKVNPLGGCLPLVFQMPVLFALFYVFQRTIEFRGAEGFAWIHDLSQPDPYYVLPVAMGLTTFLQQKLTPTPTDPKMKPMLYIMPFFMTFIFLKFSSGLVLYYTIFNVIQIIQQAYIQKRYHAPAHAVAAVAGGGSVKVQAPKAPRNKGGKGRK